MAMKPEQMAALDMALADQGGAADPAAVEGELGVGGEPGPVVECLTCGTIVDTLTGAPAEPGGGAGADEAAAMAPMPNTSGGALPI